MKKIIICDQNENLISQLKKAIGTGPHQSGAGIDFVCGDIIALHEKTPNSRIVTASNPSFSPDGGLDAVLAKKYDWPDPKEFMWNDNLFFVKSVDEDRKANQAIVERALVGVLGYAAKYTMLLTGIGTGVGGLAEDVLEALIKKVLRSANLSYADLRSANLSYSDLSYSDLSSANLSYSDLRSADLRSANLRSANLRYSDLRSANLRSANLRYSDLSYSDLSYSDLSSVNLSSANLRSANLVKVIHNEETAHFAQACPEEGAFIGWKKASGCIVKLQITAKALRSSATTRKCRCSEAKVLAIYDGKKKVKKTTSSYDPSMVYEVGKIIKPKEAFDKNRWEECSSGIHFFLTREEAESWNN